MSVNELAFRPERRRRRQALVGRDQGQSVRLGNHQVQGIRNTQGRVQLRNPVPGT